MIVPIPSSTITLFVFINWRTPPVSVFTTLSLRFCMVGRSTRGFSITIPCLAASFFAKEKWSLEVSSALLGIQPMFRQVPPSSLSFSMIAVLSPSWPARMAADVAARAGTDNYDIKLVHKSLARHSER